MAVRHLAAEQPDAAATDDRDASSLACALTCSTPRGSSA
jgi:hypothetical protein